MQDALGQSMVVDTVRAAGILLLTIRCDAKEPSPNNRLTGDTRWLTRSSDKKKNALPNHLSSYPKDKRPTTEGRCYRLRTDVES